MSSKLLLISHLAPPVINAESILVWKTLSELARHLDVTLLTAALQPDSRIDSKMIIPPSVNVIRSSTHLPKHQLFRKLIERVIGRFADEQYLWARFASLPEDEFDIIYSRSHPGASHILAYRLKQILKRPWIAQFSDPWSMNPYHHDHSRLRRICDKHWEKRVVSEADLLVFPTKEIADMYADAYPDFRVQRKSLVLPHHYAPELYPGCKQTSLAPDKVSFAYFGDFYGLRSPEPLLQALHRLHAECPNLRHLADIFFYGNVESKFSSLVNHSPIPIRRQKVSYFESLKRMSEMDVLLLIDAPTNGRNPFLPSKLVDYLGAGKPIIGVTNMEGTTADILRTHGHVVISPSDTEGFTQAIKHHLRMSRTPVTPPADLTTAHVIGRLIDKMHRMIMPQENLSLDARGTDATEYS